MAQILNKKLLLFLALAIFSVISMPSQASSQSISPPDLNGQKVVINQFEYEDENWVSIDFDRSQFPEGDIRDAFISGSAYVTKNRCDPRAISSSSPYFSAVDLFQTSNSNIFRARWNLGTTERISETWSETNKRSLFIDFRLPSSYECDVIGQNIEPELVFSIGDQEFQLDLGGDRQFIERDYTFEVPGKLVVLKNRVAGIPSSGATGHKTFSPWGDKSFFVRGWKEPYAQFKKTFKVKLHSSIADCARNRELVVFANNGQYKRFRTTTRTTFLKFPRRFSASRNARLVVKPATRNGFRCSEISRKLDLSLGIPSKEYQQGGGGAPQSRGQSQVKPYRVGGGAQ